MAPLKLLVLDLDGTVADSLSVSFKAFGDALEPSLGFRPSDAEIRARFGPADHEIVGSWVGPAERDAALARLYEAYDREFVSLRVFDGVAEAVEVIRAAGVEVALFTGRGRRSTDDMLARLNIAAWFSMSVTSDEISRPKPDPEGIRLILAHHGVSAESAVYVGDTLMDAEAAEAAGVRAIAALWGSWERSELLSAGVETAEQPEDLQRLLGI